MYWIFSRFSDETMKMVSACWRKVGKLMSEIGNAMIYQLVVIRNCDLVWAIHHSAKRIAYTRFHPETGTKLNIQLIL